MSVDESMSQMLELYLDGELSPEQRAAFEQRLEADGELADQLDERRLTRMTRAAAWRSLEPDASQSQAVLQAIDQSLRRQMLWQKRATAMRWVSAAAASIVVGIGIGWATQSTVIPASSPAQPVTAINSYNVSLTDPGGQVVAVHRFESAEHARKFSEQVTAWQKRGNAVDASTVKP